MSHKTNSLIKQIADGNYVTDSPIRYFLVIFTTCVAFLTSIISLLLGWLTIFQNIFYIPIILACIYYTKRGFLFSVFLAFGYFGMMLVFSHDFIVILGAFIRVLFFIIVASVITHIMLVRLRAERSLRNTKERLRQRTIQLKTTNKDLQAFSYSVAHDLRAPLRAIDGFTHILLEDHQQHLNEEGKRLCSIICNNTDRMSQLIDDLLDYSRLNRTELVHEPIDMETIVRLVIDDLITAENRAKIDIKVEPLSTTFGDPVMLRQVWVNLLSNAIKFSSRVEHTSIEIGCESSQRENTYFVRDNGVGFDMKYANKLFNTFQRLHSVKEFEGTGIGLAIVKSVISRHCGRVWVKAEVGKGATFYFSLPKGRDTA